MHHPLTDSQADFEMNRPTRYQITAKRNSWHRRTDGQTDRRTDRRSFFVKKENNTKIGKKYQKSITSAMYHRKA